MKPVLLIAITCLIGAMLLLPLPVSADEAKPTITHVYFEKGGVPYNGSVHYTVKCYGYQTARGVLPYQTPKPGETHTREMVYSYSATCPGYGCTIYEPYYHVDRKRIDRCDLEGTTNGNTFWINNFSTLPYTRCNGLFRPYSSIKWNTTRTYYYPTPEYQSCQHVADNKKNRWEQYHQFFSETGTPIQFSGVVLLPGNMPLYQTSPERRTYVNRSDIRMDTGRYIAYLENCNPSSDPFCPGWMVNGRPLKQYTEYRLFMHNATHLEEHPCDTFLVTADPHILVVANEIPQLECLYTGACNVPDEGHVLETFDIGRTCANTHCTLAQDFCESRFTIPAGSENSVNTDISLSEKLPHGSPSIVPEANATSNAAVPRTSSPVSVQPALPATPAPDSVIIPRSPVESLFCSIVQFLGGRCE
ncbi:MAG: hypothetical protein Q7V05_12910 [Methanoregula sp.]|nr:hypothetical protein [Methanoregula sp.]